MVCWQPLLAKAFTEILQMWEDSFGNEERRKREEAAAGGGGTSSQAVLELMQRMRRQYDDIQMVRPHLDLALKCGGIQRGERRRGLWIITRRFICNIQSAMARWRNKVFTLCKLHMRPSRCSDSIEAVSKHAVDWDGRKS